MNGQSRPAAPPVDRPGEDAGPPERQLLPDAGGDVSVAISPRQLAFLALIAALILTVLRRLAGRRRGGH